jgi:hypothetical protein
LRQPCFVDHWAACRAGNEFRKDRPPLIKSRPAGLRVRHLGRCLWRSEASVRLGETSVTREAEVYAKSVTDESGHRLQAKFPHDLVLVGFCSPFRNLHKTRRLLHRFTFSDQLQDLSLTRSELSFRALSRRAMCQQDREHVPRYHWGYVGFTSRNSMESVK